MYLDYLDLVPEWNNDNFNDIEVEEWKQKNRRGLLQWIGLFGLLVNFTDNPYEDKWGLFS